MEAVSRQRLQLVVVTRKCRKELIAQPGLHHFSPCDRIVYPGSNFGRRHLSIVIDYFDLAVPQVQLVSQKCASQTLTDNDSINLLQERIFKL